MGLLSPHLAPLPGADAVLAAHAPALPQPDQLCGPFSAWVALHAVLPEPPALVGLAQAAGTAVWPEDVAAWRPSGAPLVRTGWDALPRAASPGESGTDATGLAAALAAVPGVAVVPAVVDSDAALVAVLHGLVELERPVGVLANVRTGPLGLAWDVGHFVVVHAVAPGEVAIADTYRELGAPGRPPGCRVVSVAALHAGLTAPPGRGLLVLVAEPDEPAVRRLVLAAGAACRLWSA